MDELAHGYLQFERRASRRNRAEVGAGLVSMAVAVYFLWKFKPMVAPIGWVMLGGFACIMMFLAVRGSARRMPVGIGFASLQALYAGELARQHRLRCFMWWWYFVPLFVGLTIHLIARGMKIDQPVLSLLGVAVALLLGFCIARLNRDRGRGVHDEIRRVAAAKERLRPENDLA
jgi:hypothetical protein